MKRMITLSQKRLNHAYVLARLVSDSNFTNAEAAEVMGLSKRQVIRLKGEFKKQGVEALVYKNMQVWKSVKMLYLIYLNRVHIFP